MKEIDWYTLSYFQQRGLLAIIAEMNKVAKNRIPDLAINAFDLIRDSQAAGIILNPRVNGGREDIQVLNRIRVEFDEKLQSALEFINPFRPIAAEAVSLALWRTMEAFLVKDEGIILASGLLSPFYIDNAILFAHPYFMNTISSFAEIEIQTTMGEVDGIIGGESRGVPFATLIANRVNKGTGIARKAIKDHGTKKGVEGSIKPGDRIVIIEDLITKGDSKGAFIDDIQREGAKVVAILVVFDREQGGPQYIKEKYGIEVVSLTNITTHLEVGVRYRHITEKQKQSIEKYREDPNNWKPILAQV